MSTRFACQRYRRLIVSDDDAEQALLLRHADDCADCADFLAGDRELLDTTREWADDTPAPPPGLESRILEAIELESSAPVPLRRVPRDRVKTERRFLGGPRWAATAAGVVLLVSVGVLAVTALSDGTPRELATAIDRVEQTQQDYARAIALLEEAAGEVLAKASDPTLDTSEAAILLNYRDRLTHLDSVIAEVQGFLDEHPGNSGGHTVLLAAYKEKAEVLMEIIDRGQGDHT